MYTSKNFRTKKEMKAALASGEIVRVYEPGILYNTPQNGTIYIEGPWYPAAHTWYAEGYMVNGILVSVRK